jgi:hypothetical protein
MNKRWILMSVIAVSVVGGSSFALRAAEEEEGKEVHIKFSEAPQAVQKTLTAEAFGAKIDGVDKETKKDGKEIYEADAVIDGTNYEIKVAPDGTLISKKIDNEDNDKKDAKKTQGKEKN